MEKKEDKEEQMLYRLKGVCFDGQTSKLYNMASGDVVGQIRREGLRTNVYDSSDRLRLSVLPQPEYTDARTGLSISYVSIRFTRLTRPPCFWRVLHDTLLLTLGGRSSHAALCNGYAQRHPGSFSVDKFR